MKLLKIIPDTNEDLKIVNYIRSVEKLWNEREDEQKKRGKNRNYQVVNIYAMQLNRLSKWSSKTPYRPSYLTS